MKPWSAVATTTVSVPDSLAQQLSERGVDALELARGLRALRAVAMRRGVVGGPVGVDELAFRARFHRGLDLGNEALQLSYARRSAFAQWYRLYSEAMISAEDTTIARACMLSKIGFAVNALLGTEAFVAQRQHVAARAEGQRRCHAARLAEIRVPAGDAVLERCAAGVRGGDRRCGGRGKHRGERASPPARQLAARALTHQVVVAQAVDDDEHDIARGARVPGGSSSASGGCRRAPSARLDQRSDRLTRLPPPVRGQNAGLHDREILKVECVHPLPRFSPCGSKSISTRTFRFSKASRKRQLEQAFAPLLEYLDADGLSDVKSLEPEEPGIRFDEKDLLLYLCWTGEIGRSFHGALEATLENLGPYCYEAVEVDVTTYLENGEQESKLLFVGPTAQAIHEAQRRCMVEDVAAILGRQFDKAAVTQVSALVNELFDRDWKEKASQEKKPERAFETYTRPSRKNLH